VNLTYSQRLALMVAMGGAAILLVLVRLYELQVVDHAHWQDALKHRSNTERTIEGERGRILDAQGVLLAADGPGFDLMVVTAGWAGTLHRCSVCTHEIYLRPKDKDSFKRCPQCKKPSKDVLENLGTRCYLAPLAQLLGTNREALRKRLDTLTGNNDERVQVELNAITISMSPRRKSNLEHQLRRDYGWQPIVFRRDVSYEVAREVLLHPDRNPPFRIRESRTRRNFGGESFAHVIGQLPNRVERARSRLKGKGGGFGSGLEGVFDDELRGEPGSVRKGVDPNNRNRLIVVARETPVKGLDLRLTIAKKDQIAAQQALAGKVGAFVVVNARTGAVLAMTSAPTFDPDHYRQAVVAAMQQPSLPSPLLPRAVRGAYPPGSTMKPFTGIAALTSGLLTPDDTIQCDKYYVLRGKTMHGTMSCMGMHGPTKLSKALIQSCNIYFQTIVDRLIESGKEPHFKATLHAFGFGEPTHLEIESAWVAKWTLRLDPPGRKIPLGGRIQAGIGQGRVTATAAQVARAYAGLATGYLPELHIVESMGDTPTRIKRERLVVAAGHLEAIRRGLRKKTQHDTSLGHPAYAEHQVGTKTGTAQQRNKPTYIAWLAGFADAQANRPPIAFAMVIEDSFDYGGATCGDLVGEFLAAFYGADTE